MTVLDLGKFKKASTAAKHLAAWCRERAKDLGQKPTEVVLREPDSESRSWRVAWEAGPFEWGHDLTGGNSYMASELLDYSSPPEVLFESDNWEVCPYMSFELGFFDRAKESA